MNTRKFFTIALSFLLFQVMTSALAFDAGGDSRLAGSVSKKLGHEVNKPQFDRITNMDELMTRQPNPNVNVNGIGILVYDGMYSLDAFGPYQVFRSAGLNAFFIGKTKNTVTASNGLTVTPSKSIHEVNKLDVLLIPGGALGTALQTIDEEVLEWIRTIDETSIYTTSVCTGAWILGATGLLHGKNASTHWYRAEEMLTKYGANYTGKRWTRDGKYWTSAGVTGGIDLSLALVNHLFGKQYTQAVMLDMEYDPKPPVPGGTPEKSDKTIAQLMKDMYDSFMINFVNCPLGTPGACLFN